MDPIHCAQTSDPMLLSCPRAMEHTQQIEVKPEKWVSVYLLLVDVPPVPNQLLFFMLQFNSMMSEVTSTSDGNDA